MTKGIRLTAVPAGDVSTSVEIDDVRITLGGKPETVTDEQLANVQRLEGFEFEVGGDDRYDLMDADEVATEAAFRSIDNSGTKAATTKLLRKADKDAAEAADVEPDATDDAPADDGSTPPETQDGGK